MVHRWKIQVHVHSSVHTISISTDIHSLSVQFLLRPLISTFPTGDADVVLAMEGADGTLLQRSGPVHIN